MSTYTPAILRFMLFDDGRVEDCFLLADVEETPTPTHPLYRCRSQWDLEHVTHVNQFSAGVLEKIAVLMVLDPNDRLRGGDSNRIEGVGRRISQYTYWVELGEEDGIYAGSESEEEGTRDPEGG
jgi:hypothetical protein